MFIVKKRIEIAGAHHLDLHYDSPCSRIHGHNWIIGVEISSEELNKEGMVMDFSDIKKIVNQLDHQCLNKIKCPMCQENVTPGILPEGINPTAENIAKWIHDQLHQLILDTYQAGETHHSTRVDKITVQESEGNIACYIP